MAIALLLFACAAEGSLTPVEADDSAATPVGDIETAITSPNAPLDPAPTADVEESGAESPTAIPHEIRVKFRAFAECPSGGGWTGAIRVRASATGAQIMDAAILPADSPIQHVEIDGFTMPFDVTLGSSTLPWTTVAPNDDVLIDNALMLLQIEPSETDERADQLVGDGTTGWHAVRIDMPDGGCAAPIVGTSVPSAVPTGVAAAPAAAPTMTVEEPVPTTEAESNPVDEDLVATPIAMPTEIPGEATPVLDDADEQPTDEGTVGTPETTDDATPEPQTTITPIIAPNVEAEPEDTPTAAAVSGQVSPEQALRVSTEHSELDVPAGEIAHSRIRIVNTSSDSITFAVSTEDSTLGWTSGLMAADGFSTVPERLTLKSGESLILTLWVKTPDSARPSDHNSTSIIKTILDPEPVAPSYCFTLSGCRIGGRSHMRATA